tara:strand:- start:543 stop:1124 length:582 start_codon:yes stop_codon:yes gene_type:complete
MAYGISIPGRSVASNYAASFRPVTAVPGFSQVKSDLVANYLMQVPMLKQQLEMEMANNALKEIGSIKRTEMNIDSAMDQLEQQRKNEILGAILKSDSSGSGMDDLVKFQSDQNYLLNTITGMTNPLTEQATKSAEEIMAESLSTRNVRPQAGAVNTKIEPTATQSAGFQKLKADEASVLKLMVQDRLRKAGLQ